MLSSVPPAASPLRLKCFTKQANAGDGFNLALLAHYAPAWPLQLCGPAPLAAHNLVLLGSVLEWADPHSLVCGAGFVSAAARLQLSPRRLALVRGPLTAASLVRQGLAAAGELAWADPGVLVARLFASQGPEDCAFGVIPHYVDLAEPALQAVAATGGLVIDPRQPLPAYLAQLQRCRVILSSSLHGLIFAHAYGKPALWLDFGDRVIGDGFKFFDYFQSLGLPTEAVSRVRVGPSTALASLLGRASAVSAAQLEALAARAEACILESLQVLQEAMA